MPHTNFGVSHLGQEPVLLGKEGFEIYKSLYEVYLGSGMVFSPKDTVYWLYFQDPSPGFRLNLSSLMAEQPLPMVEVKNIVGLRGLGKFFSFSLPFSLRFLVVSKGLGL